MEESTPGSEAEMEESHPGLALEVIPPKGQIARRNPARTPGEVVPVPVWTSTPGEVRLQLRPGSDAWIRAIGQAPRVRSFRTRDLRSAALLPTDGTAGPRNEASTPGAFVRSFLSLPRVRSGCVRGRSVSTGRGERPPIPGALGKHPG